MDETTGVRLNKFIADSGLCSRREADKLIAEGHVRVNGRAALMGERVTDGAEVTVDGQPLRRAESHVYIAFNKPVGLICTTDPRVPDNVVGYVRHERRLFPIGRLDVSSQGLLLMTSDGDIVNRILRAAGRHEKEYLVTVDKPATDEFLEGICAGVPMLGTVTLPCWARRENACTFRLVLTQGLNRQIRRMCEYFGYQVVSLTRLRVMNVTTDGLRVGQWRDLTQAELAELFSLLEEEPNHDMASSSDWDAD